MTKSSRAMPPFEQLTFFFLKTTKQISIRSSSAVVEGEKKEEKKKNWSKNTKNKISKEKIIGMHTELIWKTHLAYLNRLISQ
jgi:hypothetical protein